MRSMVEGAIPRRTRVRPSTTLRAVPLPRVAEEGLVNCKAIAFCAMMGNG